MSLRDLLRKSRVLGCPFHGALVWADRFEPDDAQLTLFDDTTVGYDNDQDVPLPGRDTRWLFAPGHVVLLRHPAAQALESSPEEEAYDAAHHYAWLDYAVVAGEGFLAGQFELFGPFHGWTYCDARQLVPIYAEIVADGAQLTLNIRRDTTEGAVLATVSWTPKKYDGTTSTFSSWTGVKMLLCSATTDGAGCFVNVGVDGEYPGIPWDLGVYQHGGYTQFGQVTGDVFALHDVFKVTVSGSEDDIEAAITHYKWAPDLVVANVPFPTKPEYTWAAWSDVYDMDASEWEACIASLGCGGPTPAGPLSCNYSWTFDITSELVSGTTDSYSFTGSRNFEVICGYHYDSDDDEVVVTVGGSYSQSETFEASKSGDRHWQWDGTLTKPEGSPYCNDEHEASASGTTTEVYEWVLNETWSSFVKVGGQSYSATSTRTQTKTLSGRSWVAVPAEPQGTHDSDYSDGTVVETDSWDTGGVESLQATRPANNCYAINKGVGGVFTRTLVAVDGVSQAGGHDDYHVSYHPVREEFLTTTYGGICCWI